VSLASPSFLPTLIHVHSKKMSTCLGFAIIHLPVRVISRSSCSHVLFNDTAALMQSGSSRSAGLWDFAAFYLVKNFRRSVLIFRDLAIMKL
jgi:hypothetical protein